MSSITPYKCSANCGFNVRLSFCMPVWKEDTPEELRVLPVGLYGQKYVSGYSNDRYCTKCRSVVSLIKKNDPVIRPSFFLKTWSRLFPSPSTNTEEDVKTTCPKCEAENSFLDENDACPNCKTGVVLPDKALIMRF